MMDEKTFIAEFVRLAIQHNDCLATHDYSKRSRINKKLLNMLSTIQKFENPASVISEIIDYGNDYATLWISNYAMKNNLCVEVVRQKLQEIKDSKKGPDAITAWALLTENS